MALQEIGWSPEGLAFHPEGEPAQILWNQIQSAREAALNLVRRPEITAVVAANDDAARGLLQALRVSGVPGSRWPAVVGFDNLPNLRGHMVTSLRLPGRELGRPPPISFRSANMACCAEIPATARSRCASSLASPAWLTGPRTRRVSR